MGPMGGGFLVGEFHGETPEKFGEVEFMECSEGDWKDGSVWIRLEKNGSRKGCLLLCNHPQCVVEIVFFWVDDG